MPEHRLSWRLCSPPGRGGLAIIELTAPGPVLDGAIAELAGQAIAPGAHRLSSIAGVDRGVVARSDAERALLMPHGGPQIVRALARLLADRFGPESSEPDLGTVEARMVESLARAQSPRAIELLLRQPALWAGVPDPFERASQDRDRRLRRLIEPPVVVLRGPVNSGKSSLTNALAGRSVSVAAPVAGTTLDYVGVHVEVDGLVIELVDTPGVREAPGVEAEAQAAARVLAESADLVVHTLDLGEAAVPGDGPGSGLLVGTRADLAPGPGAPGSFDVVTSAATGEGLGELGVAIRRALVPDGDLESGEPWVFWGVSA